MPKIKLAGPSQRADAKAEIDKAPDGWLVNITEDKETRTSQQNRTLHMWFGEIAKHLEDWDAHGIKGVCHRKWGLTIRLRDPQFAWVWERSGKQMPYEKQCSLLASGILSVSSEMSTKELSEYMDAMFQHYTSEGIRLTDPELRKYEQMEEGR